MTKVYLVSDSRRRQRLLSFIINDFDIISPTREVTYNTGKPSEKAEMIAMNKALEARERNPEGLYIAAETIIVFKDKELGKPKDNEQAIDYLKLLSGKKHSVYTGVALLYEGKNITFHAKTTIKFRNLDDDVLQKYIESGEYQDHYGAYSAYGVGSILIDNVEGDLYNSLGLPMADLYSQLVRIGYFSI